jgi:hypothetical protein
MLDFYSSHDFQHLHAFYTDQIWSELSPRCWVYSGSSLVFFVFFIFYAFDLFCWSFLSFCVFGTCIFFLSLFSLCFWVKPEFLVRFMVKPKISSQPGRVKKKDLYPVSFITKKWDFYQIKLKKYKYIFFFAYGQKS